MTTELQVPKEAAGERLDRWLAGAVPWLTHAKAKRLLELGRVRIGKKLARGERKLWGGETVVIEPLEAPKAPKTPVPEIALPVLFEDDDLVVVDKPAGLVVDWRPSGESVVALLAARLRGFDFENRAQPGVVHRLDKDTTGCLALAKTDESWKGLLTAFQAKEVDKRYLALVLGTPKAHDRIDTPYGKKPGDSRKYTTQLRSARRAVLEYDLREQLGDVALLDVHLDTGRTHQIRVQLAERGLPVIGDPVYGKRECREHPLAKALGRHALHAARLELPHPRTGERLVFESPVPADLAAAIENARGT